MYLFNYLGFHCCQKVWPKSYAEDFEGTREIMVSTKCLSGQNVLECGFIDFVH